MLIHQTGNKFLARPYKFVQSRSKRFLCYNARGVRFHLPFSIHCIALHSVHHHHHLTSLIFTLKALTERAESKGLQVGSSEIENRALISALYTKPIAVQNSPRPLDKYPRGIYRMFVLLLWTELRRINGITPFCHSTPVPASICTANIVQKR